MKTDYISPELFVFVIHTDTILTGSTTTDEFSINPIDDGGEF